jgi:hypothetical protein
MHIADNDNQAVQDSSLLGEQSGQTISEIIVIEIIVFYSTPLPAK